MKWEELPDEKRLKWKTGMKRVLFPHRFIIFLLFHLSVVLLVYSLGYENARTEIQYFSYPFSAYTLIVVCARVPEMVRWIKKQLYKNKLASRYLTEQQLRDTVSLHTGSVIDIIFAVFKLIMGIWFRSHWLMAAAVYHMVLSAMHMMLLANRSGKKNGECREQVRLKQWNSYRLCGIMMGFLNLAMSGMLVQIIWQGQRFQYPGFLVYAFAAYAFYCLIMAVIKVIQYWRVENPIFSASKSIRMAKALMSLFTLQTALLTQFGTEEIAEFEMLMNMVTGGSVCVLVLVMAVLMVRRANKEIEAMKKGAI